MKRRVKQNVWGNWRGYEGSKFVREFSAGHGNDIPQEAQDWLDRKPEPPAPTDHTYWRNWEFAQ